MKIALEIRSQDIADLMVTAIEANNMTRAWCTGVYLLSPSEGEAVALGEFGCVWYAKPEIFESAFKIQVDELIDEDGPGNNGENLREHLISSVDFAEGFRLMAEKSPDHFGDFISGNYDIITADVWLQYVVLKEVIYG
jgi:hypothetical protein